MNGRSYLTNGRSWVTIHFSEKLLCFSIRYGPWTVDRNLPCPPKVYIFHQKVETYSRCCPRISAIGLPGFHNFAHKFSLTRFFPQKGVNFNFFRQNKYDKIRPIISYRRHNLVNTHTKSTQIVLQSPEKNSTRFLPTFFRNIQRHY